jgi:antitoxin (DNA-binding transcriptional repressor) of toxin-antitoxin stability system/predicted nucleic acid-binding protein
VRQWPMRHAGIREARQNLSGLLQSVHQGHEIVITDRGRPVARLVAPLPLSPKPFPGRSAFRRTMPELRPGLSTTLVGADSLLPASPWPSSLVGPLYLGPAALARLYLPERGSGPLDRALTARRDLTVSDLSVTELVVAFTRRARGSAQREAVARLQTALLHDLESGFFRRVEISPSSHRAAERLALSLGGRMSSTSAALHLALAMTAGVAGLVTLDREMAGAAQSVGLAVVPPGQR